jgi:RNA polymerase sigma-70 factor, ECF subfamily
VIGTRVYAHHRLVLSASLMTLLDPRAVLAGDDSVRLRDMFTSYFDGIWRLLRRSGLSNERADDAAQEVFIIASQKVASIAHGSERSFLYGTALRVASTTRRSAEYRREHVAAEDDVAQTLGADETAPSGEDLLDQHRARQALDQILDTMDDDLREALVLFEIEGMQVPEIAEALSIPTGTAASRLRRAREVFDQKVNARFPKRMRQP